MGGNQSNLNKKKDHKFTDIEPLDAIHLIATKYILSQSFTDMKKLTSKDYCDKLVILTSDIVKKFMTTKNIEYLSHRVENGVPIDELKKADVIFLDINDVKKKKKTDIAKTNQKYIYENNVGWLPMKEKPITKKRLFETMDINNAKTKDRMCKGIAKFYIKIAHVFAAISQTINPIFSYTDENGKAHVYSIKNKDKIPENAKIKVTEENFCTRRMNALQPSIIGNKIKIIPSKICSVNKTTKNITQKDIMLSKWGQTISIQKNLGNEPGIPELEELYNDVYDYTSGKYISMSSKNKKIYEKNLKTFYVNFTGEKILPYKEWNKSKNKRFSDIMLQDVSALHLCNDKKSDFNQPYENDTDLYKKYATHFKEMMSKAKNGQKDLIIFLDQIFIWQNNNDIDSLTIHPDLTEKKLEKLTGEIRDKIMDLYFNCENDFKSSINIIESIIAERNLKNAQAKNDLLLQQVSELTGAN